MKFVVTYIRQSRYSRRRVGKSATELIDTTERDAFRHCTKPEEVEAAYESLYAGDKSLGVKVIDVRLVVPTEEDHALRRVFNEDPVSAETLEKLR